MARRALRDTYVFVDVEDAIGGTVPLRRRIRAGDIVADFIRFEDEAAFEIVKPKKAGSMSFLPKKEEKKRSSGKEKVDSDR